MTTEKIFFMSQAQVEKFNPQEFGGDWALVSVTDPGARPPKVADAFKDVLTLKFLDNPALDGLTDNAVTELVAYLEAQINNGRNIAIHCFLGVSRSGAIAKYLDLFCEKQNMLAYSEENKVLKKMLLAKKPIMVGLNKAQVFSHPSQTCEKVTCIECFGQGCEKCNFSGKLSKFWYL